MKIVVSCSPTCEGKNTEPDGNLGSLRQSVPGTLQSSVDLPHLYDSFQPHHLQTLITYICEATTHKDPIQISWWQPHARGQVGLIDNIRDTKNDMWDHAPCEIVFSSSGSVMTSLDSTFGTPSGFLDSPQRLEPPCMLGMLRTAMPSRDMLLRSRGLPQHWQKQNNNCFLCTELKKLYPSYECQMICFGAWNSNLNCKRVLHILAGGGDGLRSGKFKIPKFVLHS